MLYRNFETQEELDRQYNVRGAIDNLENYSDFYAEKSKETREDLKCHLDVPFGPTVAEHLDIFPATQPDAPILLFMHGGYWRSRSSKEFSFVSQGPVSKGVTTVVMNYALCPEVTIEEIVRQSRAAVVWLYENAGDYGGNKNQIHVSGHSAGGHLTAMLLATDWEEKYGKPPDIIKGACSISGLFDLEPFPYTWLQPKLQLTWGEVKRNSPINHIPNNSPPLIITYGENELPEFRRQSEDFFAAWSQNNLKGELLPQSDSNHYEAIEGFLDSDSSLCSTILNQISFPS